MTCIGASLTPAYMDKEDSNNNKEKTFIVPKSSEARAQRSINTKGLGSLEFNICTMLNLSTYG